MSPFAGFVAARDVAARVEMGQLAPADAPAEVAARGRQVEALTRSLRDAGRLRRATTRRRCATAPWTTWRRATRPSCWSTSRTSGWRRNRRTFPAPRPSVPTGAGGRDTMSRSSPRRPRWPPALERIDRLRRRIPGAAPSADADRHDRDRRRAADEPPDPGRPAPVQRGDALRPVPQAGRALPAGTGAGAAAAGRRGAGARPPRTGRGPTFAVWAPNAVEVSVIGDFNGWDPRAHPLQPQGTSGIWAGTVPGVGPGSIYKYHLSLPGQETGAGQGRPLRVPRRDLAQDRLHRLGPGLRLGRRRVDGHARPPQRAGRADRGLRDAPRLVDARARGRATAR